MPTDSSPSDAVSKAPDASQDCPLPHRDQMRNILLYALNFCMIYLGAPVLYVSICQAALLDTLGANRKLANLPSTAYFWMTPVPILVAWYFHSVRTLKPVLVIGFAAAGLGGGLVGLVLLSDSTNETIFAAVLMHAGLLGICLNVAATFQWEILGRGVSASLRGRALGLTYGIGPILAFISSLASQLILTGKVLLPTIGPGLKLSMEAVVITPIAYPYNFAALFIATTPLLLVCAVSSSQFVVLLPAVELPREPLVSGIFGGMWEFFEYRLILLAALALVLVGSGYNIMSNISLYTQEALGESPDKYVGYQNALRFGCKALAGGVLGWLLTRTNPKAGMLFTGSCCLASVVWAICVPGKLFLLSFALMGAGELFGVYFPNYILCCSEKSRMRRNMSFASMLNMPTGLAALGYGFVADAYGIRASFYVSAGILVAMLLVVMRLLPSHPSPRNASRPQ